MTSALTGCAPSEAAPRRAATPQASAFVDSADFLASFDGSADLPAYRTALDAWQAVCRQGREVDAGYVNSVYRTEQAHNAAERSRLLVMRHLTASAPTAPGGADCGAVAAAYLSRNSL